MTEQDDRREKQGKQKAVSATAVFAGPVNGLLAERMAIYQRLAILIVSPLVVAIPRVHAP